MPYYSISRKFVYMQYELFHALLLYTKTKELIFRCIRCRQSDSKMVCAFKWSTDPCHRTGQRINSVWLDNYTWLVGATISIMPCHFQQWQWNYSAKSSKRWGISNCSLPNCWHQILQLLSLRSLQQRLVVHAKSSKTRCHDTDVAMGIWTIWLMPDIPKPSPFPSVGLMGNKAMSWAPLTGDFILTF